MAEKLSENYLRFKNTILIRALSNVICNEKYSKKDIMQFRYNNIIDTIPEGKGKINLKADYLDMERGEYIHIDRIVEKLFRKNNIKLRTVDEIKNSKVLGKETILDEKVIEEQDRLLGILQRDDMEPRVRSNMVLPADLMEQIDSEVLKKFDEYQIHAFTKDIHRYLPKNGLISLIDMYVISILTECINGRTVGILDKTAATRKKAEEKLREIEEAVMCPEKEEILGLICVHEIFDALVNKYENTSAKAMVEIESYWVYTLPIVQLLLDNILKPEDRKAEKNKLWEKIEYYYSDLLLNRWSLDISNFYFSEEYAISENNLEEAFDLYYEIKLIIDEIRISVLNIVKEIPMFRIKR